MKKYKIYIYALALSFSFALLSCSADTEVDSNKQDGTDLLPGTPDNGTENPDGPIEVDNVLILHDAVKADSKVEFKLNSKEAVKWSISNGTDSSKPKATSEKSESAQLDVVAGKNTVTATFDNGTTISADIYVPATTSYSIDLSEGHTFISNGENGSLYVYGNNENGQLCLPKSIASVKDPEVLLSGKNIVSVATGDKHSLYADGTEVFACGDNSKGQLGIGNTNAVDKATKVIGLQAIQDGSPVDTPIGKVILAAGGDMSSAIVVTNSDGEGKKHKGDTYFWGINLDNSANSISTPKYSTKSGDNQWATDSEPTIAAGNNFVLTKPFGYNFFSYGKNDSWQLGRIDTISPVSGMYNEGHIIIQNPDYSKNISTNKFSTVMNNMFTPYGVLKEPTSGSTPNYFSSNPKSIAAAGGNFSLIISKEVPFGEDASTVPTIVYVVGGKASTLGLKRNDGKDIITRAYPIMTSGTKIDTKDKLKKPGSGLDPELENNELFTGVKVYNTGDDLQITNVTAKQVAAGNQNGYILAEDGSLYAFGPNDKNQLTSNNTANSTNGKIVTIAAPASGVTYQDIWAGGNRAIALGSDNNLYTWGEKIATPTKMFFKGTNQVIKTK